ncbi:hypothetical protein NMY22_g18544 [Coprinellus aureogranulatus]|nr:hypothetical protein NMY22_g18544 [Coprinellus aureogranulatus]
MAFESNLEALKSTVEAPGEINPILLANDYHSGSQSNTNFKAEAGSRVDYTQINSPASGAASPPSLNVQNNFNILYANFQRPMTPEQLSSLKASSQATPASSHPIHASGKSLSVAPLTGTGDEDASRMAETTPDDDNDDGNVPQGLEQVSKEVEDELKQAIMNFMSKGHAALAPPTTSTET